ncbi:hypothetical protein PFISCL1PPCAC_23511 [Pristionchus fissidentatus]|uniref:Palmitoyltransferase n=1 Tax=Pristionchus fissidentatus TaxID=1538716 RepID=A0AAV5WR60_9BILA|nr:hypothetical protein PFISCL1PPCAC_23511 [Pristionchus fissidentatus]
MTIFLVFLPIAFLFEVFFVVSDFHEMWSSPWLLRVGILSGLFINCYINYVLMVRAGPNGRNTVLPNTVQVGFRFCHSCRAQSPPRAYHCPVCDSCGFRRDHHCSFGAVCVGHFNQRYFVAAVINLWLVCATVVTYNWPWLSSRLGHFSVIQWWQILLPHLALVLRLISLMQFFCILVMSFSLVVLLFVTYLVTAQVGEVFCIARGQTRVEYLLEVHAYQLGLLNNIKHSLGANWLVGMVIPFVPLRMPSSGMHFETREMEKHANSKSL